MLGSGNSNDPHVQLSADIKFDNYLGDPQASGFTPPETMKVAESKKLIRMQSVYVCPTECAATVLLGLIMNTAQYHNFKI